MDDLKTLIFRTDRIGDFIISCPFILSYKKKYKDNKIVIISSEYNFNYIKNFKFINKIFPLKNEIKFIKKIFVLIKMIFLLRSMNFSDIIVLDGKKRSFFISLFLKGKKSILLQSKSLEFFSKIFKYKIVHNYELQDQFKNISYLASLLNFNINNNDIEVYKSYNFNNSINLEQKYIVIHLDEKWFTKYYYKDFTDINPTSEQLKIFIEKIFYSLDGVYNIVLTSGSKELNVLKKFTDEFELNVNEKFLQKKIQDKYIFFMRKSTFNDLELIIKKSSFLICCEGGVSHASHNFKVKTLALFQSNRFQHTKFWTGHMSNLILYERKNMQDMIEDANFYNLIRNNLPNHLKP